MEHSAQTRIGLVYRIRKSALIMIAAHMSLQKDICSTKKLKEDQHKKSTTHSHTVCKQYIITVADFICFVSTYCHLEMNHGLQPQSDVEVTC